MSNFWRSHDLPLINCEKELDLSCSKECIISEISITPTVPPDPDPNPHVQEMAATQATGATFHINNVKSNYIKFFENLKQGFKRTISWSKY